ncbi:MAG TPA: cytochrome P450 [Steroidobacteraceae bacterium]|jgi:hypothetical protein|nr:cytochrome P450 [Steroidobacteraceae bacterium]
MDADARKNLAERFDLRALTDDFYADPFPCYAALRDYAPIKRMPDGAYLLTRYDDVERVYKAPKVFSSDKRREFGAKFGSAPLYRHHTTSLVFNDPPYHTRVRRLINGALTPRVVQRIRPALEASVTRLIDAMAARGTADLIEDFAAAIPVEVIGDLLGVPRAERGPLRAWSLAILGALEPRLSAPVEEAGNRAVSEFSAYLDGLVARRRSGGADPDLLSCLLETAPDGQSLTTAELIHNAIFLLNAGHETTTNLIGNALAALARHPEERERLIADPGLIKTGVEEFLRFESPNQLGNRITTEAVRIGEAELPAGTQVTLCIGAANRDPEQFPRPDRLDVSRAPNRHLAFGSGIHQCIGMSVARLEASTAICMLLERFPHHALEGEPLRGRRARFRGHVSIPCKLC